MRSRVVCWALAGLAVIAIAACAPEDEATTAAPQPTSSTPAPSPTPTPTTEAPTAALSFAVVGDFGTGDASQRAIAGRMCDWHRKQPFDTVITTGDNIYPDGDPALFDTAFLDPYRCLFRRGVSWHASLGNHDILTDGGQPEIDEPAFGMKGHDYVVRTGGVRFVITDSNSIDREWLSGATKARASDRWTIVVFHHPVFPAGDGHDFDYDFRPELPRLFARRGVDLVLNGHDHLYAVAEVRRGVRYVISGGGGAPLVNCTNAVYTEVCRPQHHFLWLEATSDSIEVTAIPAEGPPFHRLSIQESG